MEAKGQLRLPRSHSPAAQHDAWLRAIGRWQLPLRNWPRDVPGACLESHRPDLALLTERQCTEVKVGFRVSTSQAQHRTANEGQNQDLNPDLALPNPGS